tara:strand:- start:176 stop:1228 length:1053 start_codon:yes stop_codon:yes gene_type:complete
MSKTESSKRRPRYTAIDLFSGPGGMTAGLKLAGFDVVAAVELDAIAAETFRLNHSGVALLETDIRNVTVGDLADVGVPIDGGLTVLAACPPCQGFSSIRRRNKQGPADDERNDLVLQVGRLAAELRPRAVMMENVPGLLGDERLERLVADLESLGYDTGGGPVVLDTAGFGVPQRRRRLVLLASREGRIAPASPDSQVLTVRDALRGLPPSGISGDPLHDLPERRSARIKAVIKAIPRDGGSRRDLPASMHLECHRGTDGFKDVYGRMAWDRPAPTITGGCFNPSKGRFLHPEENRNITLREAALLQGFPPGYEFSLARGKAKAAEMIGNALPPAFVAAHARQIVASVTP